MRRQALFASAVLVAACGSETVEVALPAVEGAQTLILAQAEERQSPPAFDIRVIDLRKPVTAEMLPGLGESKAKDTVRYTAVYHSASTETLHLQEGRAVPPAEDDPYYVTFADLARTSTVRQAKFETDELSQWVRTPVDPNLAAQRLPRFDDCVPLEALPGSVVLNSRVWVGFGMETDSGELLVQTRSGGLFDDPVRLYLIERDRYQRPREVTNFELSVGRAFRAGFKNRIDGSFWFIGDDYSVIRAGGVEKVGENEARLVDVMRMDTITSTNGVDAWRSEVPECDGPAAQTRFPYAVDGNATADGRFEVYVVNRSGVFERYDGRGPPQCLYDFNTDADQQARVTWIAPERVAAVVESDTTLVWYDTGRVRTEVPLANHQLTTVRMLDSLGVVVGTNFGSLLFRSSEGEWNVLPSGQSQPIYDVAPTYNPSTQMPGLLYGGKQFNAGQAWPVRDARSCFRLDLTRQTTYFVGRLGLDAYLFIGLRTSQARDDPLAGTVIVPRYE